VGDALEIQAAGSPDADGGGFADVLWRYHHEKCNLELVGPWEAIRDLLQSLALDSSDWKSSGVPLRIGYSIAEILSSALSAAAVETKLDNRQAIVVFAWHVASAWEAVLAGDIDNIAEHVKNEALARSLPRSSILNAGEEGKGTDSQQRGLT